MATLATKETNIRAVLGERVQSFWLSTELQQWYLDGQQELLERIPADAIKDLRRYLEQAFNGVTSDFSAPVTDILLDSEHLFLTMEESDGNQGSVWSLVTPEVLRDIMSNEGELAQDSTDTRIFCVASFAADGASLVDPNYVQGFQLYPTPANGRTGRLEFFIKPTTSGGLTLPLHLQRICEYYAISMAASKKSRDLDMSDRFHKRFNEGIDIIIKKYAGKYGLNQANRAFIVDVVGYD